VCVYGFCMVWVCVCVGFVMCVGVSLICVLVFNGFFIVCTVIFILLVLCVFILIYVICVV